MPETSAQPKPPFIVAVEEEPVIEDAAPPAETSSTEDEARFPTWADIPTWRTGHGFPAGRQIWFIPLRVGLMANKRGGKEITLKSGEVAMCRQVIIWELNLPDRKAAFRRAGGDPNQASDELAMQMIRAVDGVQVDWTSEASQYNPRRIWADMGPKYRDLFARLYTMFHVIGEAAVTDFFANCAEPRMASS